MSAENGVNGELSDDSISQGAPNVNTQNTEGAPETAGNAAETTGNAANVQRGATEAADEIVAVRSQSERTVADMAERDEAAKREALRAPSRENAPSPFTSARKCGTMEKTHPNGRSQ